MKVIFIDIDGPMIPLRAYSLPENHMTIVARFDPVAVAMVNRLVTEADAKIVISSTWRQQGWDKIALLLRLNGIPLHHCHADWRTPYNGDAGQRRADEILEWLGDHPEITHWVAFDDEPVPEPGGVQCTMDDGLQWAHFDKARGLLGLKQFKGIIVP